MLLPSVLMVRKRPTDTPEFKAMAGAAHRSPRPRRRQERQPGRPGPGRHRDHAPSFAPLVLEEEAHRELRIVAELVEVLGT